MARKKKRHPCPRRKRMTRRGRLSSARATRWVENYKGKNVIVGYAKWFAVDLVCALVELRLLGVKIDQGREDQIKASIEARAAQRSRRKKLREQAQACEFHPFSDDFAFIADCSRDCVPYEVCLQELEEAPLWWEEDDAIEPTRSLETAECGSRERAQHPLARRHRLNGRPNPQQ
jgi:hypothetical protein